MDAKEREEEARADLQDRAQPACGFPPAGEKRSLAHATLPLPPPPPPPQPQLLPPHPQEGQPIGNTAQHPSLPQVPHEHEGPQAPQSHAEGGAIMGAPPSQPPSPSLDFLSPSFDPLRALSTPGLQPPLPSAAPVDNIAAFRRLLPPEDPDSLSNVQPRANEASKKKHMLFKESATRQREHILASTPVSLEHVLAAAPTPGPLDCLHRWRAAGAIVRATTRHASGVRGRALGRLVAFDRFMNLVLQDVTEQYTVCLKVTKMRAVKVQRQGEAAAAGTAAAAGAAGAAGGGGGGAGGHLGGPSSAAGGFAVGSQAGTGGAGGGVELGVARKARVVRVREVRQRQLGQIFIKGDNVVSVGLAAEGEAGAAGVGTDGTRSGTPGLVGPSGQ